MGTRVRPIDRMFRELQVVLTDEERRLRGLALADAEKQLEFAKETKKEETKRLADAVKDQEAEVARLAQIVWSGKEPRDIEVGERANDAERTVEVVRYDTGEVIESRPMTEEEQQQKLFSIEDQRQRRAAGDSDSD